MQDAYYVFMNMLSQVPKINVTFVVYIIMVHKSYASLIIQAAAVNYLILKSKFGKLLCAHNPTSQRLYTTHTLTLHYIQ